MQTSGGFTCSLSIDLLEVAVAVSLWQVLFVITEQEGPHESEAFLLPGTCLAC